MATVACANDKNQKASCYHLLEELEDVKITLAPFGRCGIFILDSIFRI
jgi:hypothetical protein